MTWPNTTDSDTAVDMTAAEPGRHDGPGAPRDRRRRAGGPGGSGGSGGSPMDRVREAFRNPGAWRRGRVVAGLAVLATLPLVAHGLIPNTPGHLGSFTETFLPWFGLSIPVLLILAGVRRSWTALVATLLPFIVWTAMFGGAVFGGSSGSGERDLRVVSHNINAGNPDPAGTARKLLKADADVVALQEIPEGQASKYGAVLDKTYPFMQRRGTVAIWSKTELSDVRTVDTGMGWPRAMRATIKTPHGEVHIYNAHLASVRFGSGGYAAGQRDATINRLAAVIDADTAPNVIAVGDFNGPVTDRALDPLTDGLKDAQKEAGSGFGFTWPASFPLAAIDHVMVRGLKPVGASVLGETSSDHKPVQADLKFG